MIEPFEQLKEAIDANPGIWVLEDYHHLLTEKIEGIFASKAIDFLANKSEYDDTVILLGGIGFDVPPELTKAVSTIDLPLPDGRILRHIADEETGLKGKMISEEAIEAARMRVEAACLTGRVEFIHGSHATIPGHAAPGSVAAVMFNLGYFPGGDHAVITRTGETLAALAAALEVLKPGGLLTVVCYPGHPGGDEESAAVESWSGGLDEAEFVTAVRRRTDTLRPSPFLVSVGKRDTRDH